MEQILTNVRFAEAFPLLAGVRLNPRRHTAANALEHSEAVAARAAILARANGCTVREALLLENLGRAHDLGKITGTARPERSLDVLRGCGIDDAGFLALVKWHDTNLPWYVARTKGQPPSDKAWRRLASEVDVRLLSIFMVADRVDAPPGWRRNAPTRWFLGEAKARGLIGDLVLDLPDHPGEVSSGGVLVRELDGTREVLLVRVGARGHEVPKRAIDWDELPGEAALRAIREEAGIEAELDIHRELEHVDSWVREGADGRLMRVRYFELVSRGSVLASALPEQGREVRWVRLDDLRAVPLVDEVLRPLLVKLLESGG